MKQISFLFALSLALSAQATIRYCAPEPLGKTDNDGLSTATPKTFKTARDQLANGDELRVMKGTYYLAEGSVGSHLFAFGGPVSFRGWDEDKDSDADPEDVVIDLEGKNGLFYSVRGLEIYNLTIQNAHARTYSGGAICLAQNDTYFSEKAIVSNCIFRANYAWCHAGGAVYSCRPAMIVDCLFVGNTNDASGGAISVTKTPVSHCTFVGNYAKSNGGALYCNDTEDISCCTFSNNVSGSHGGAVYGGGELSHCVIVSNCAENCGGAFAWYGSDVRVLDDCVISNNIQLANGNWACGGGAMMLDGTYGRLSMTNCVVSYNHAKGNGGAVLMRYGALFEAYDCTFDGNYAESDVGSQYAGNASGAVLWFLNAKDDSTNRFVRCTFRNNRWTDAFTVSGGIIKSDAKNAAVYGCTFANASGNANQAILFDVSGQNTTPIIDCSFTSITNTTVANVSSPCTVSNCVFANNFAPCCALKTGTTANMTNTYACCVFTNNYSTKSANGTAGASLVSSASSMFLVASDCLFRDNTLNDGYGNTDGGICIWAGGKALIDRCSFINNTNTCYTGASGGAIMLYSTSAPDPASHVRNCLFDGNASGWHANRFASAICLYSGGSSAIPIENCTFVNNLKKAPVQCLSGSSWSDKNLINCVFAGNAVNQGTANTDHCWQGTLADAKFVDAGSNNFIPAKGSPLVNQGANADWMTGARDLRNHGRYARIVDDIVDMGCYEYRPQPGVILFVK